MHILSIDIGGTGIKAAVLDGTGQMLTDRLRVPTPKPCGPQAFLGAVTRLIDNLPGFECVAVGFPGVVRYGKTWTAPLLGNDLWHGFDLASALQRQLGKPVRILNDADLQGLAIITGQGIEMVVTLGTGFGSALFQDGHLGPHLELSVSYFEKDQTYNQRLGHDALQRIGKRRWNKRVRRAITALRTLTNFDMLYIGGGNAEHIDFTLDSDIKIIPDEDGITGGARLWQDDVPGAVHVIRPSAKVQSIAKPE